jgi:hypothetical protein
MTPGECPGMKYGELVARISEVTRTLVDRGPQGECELGSSRFRTPGELSEDIQPGHILTLPGAEGPETYLIRRVDHKHGVITVDRSFTKRVPRYWWAIYAPGVSEEDVRRVLFAFPDVIMECEEGEQVRTYLGTFRITRRKRKRVKDPLGNWTFSEEKIVARIRPGKRLQREIGSSGPSNPPQSVSDEDPQD